MTRWLMGLGLVLVSVTAEAQFVPNPTRVLFTPSADDAQVARYEIGYFFVGAAEPVQVGDLGRPSCDAGCDIVLPARPVPVGRYEARVRAYAADPALVSPWSEPSNEFGYTPRSVDKPAVEK